MAMQEQDLPVKMAVQPQFVVFDARKNLVRDREFGDHILYKNEDTYEYHTYARINRKNRKGYLCVKALNPERFYGETDMLFMVGRFDGDGNLVGLEDDIFHAYYYWDSETAYRLKYKVDPENRQWARLDSVVEFDPERHERKLEREEVEAIGFARRGYPETVAWADTYMTYLTGKKLVAGAVPQDVTNLRYQDNRDLTAKDIKAQLLLPQAAYRREDLQKLSQERPPISPDFKAQNIIQKTRDGIPLTRQEIFDWINAIISKDEKVKIPDYQISAWLMAVRKGKLTFEETVDLTMAMAVSGNVLNLDRFGVVTDKHSSGGVGDKTTLVVAPLVAACDVIVGKMSGRGLGMTGGTLDKLESIPGFNTHLTTDQFIRQIEESGIVVTGQSGDLDPADGILYQLRDATVTIDSIPLIAASIMSKKIASGANTLVLDVKVGKGAFMKTLPEARKLARTMVDIGKSLGIKVKAEITNMDQPLGYAVGNALEVVEAVQMLRGEPTTSDFYQHCIDTAARIVHMAGKADSMDQARRLVEGKIKDQSALAKFREMVDKQGGDLGYIDDLSLLLTARYKEMVYAYRDGYIEAIDPQIVGETVMNLGGGRQKKDDSIDPDVGVLLGVKVGQKVQKDQVLFVVHANDKTRRQQAMEKLQKAVKYSDKPVRKPKLLYEVIE